MGTSNLFEWGEQQAAKPEKSTGTDWKAIVNEAAKKLQEGSDAVVEGAEAVWDYLPEKEDVAAVAEKAGSVLPTIMDTMQGIGEASLDFGTSEGRFLAHNYFNAGEPLTESDLNSVDIELLRSAVLKARSEGRSSLDYSDFGTNEEEVLKGSPLTGLFDPNMRLARTMGGVTFSTNEAGETVITNTYNFNEGPKRKAFVEAKKSGDTRAALDILIDSLSSPVELISILAYAKQEELRESGKPYETEMVFNLGKLAK